MYFIERLKINTTVLNILRFISIIYLVVLITLQISSMKNSLDELYLNSLLSISKLNEANKIYNINIQNNIHQVMNFTITPTQALLEMQKSLPIVEKIWENYEKNFSYEDKSEYLEYSLLEIREINNYFKEVNIWCSDIEQMQMLSLTDIDNKIAKANIIIQELIRYELEIAQDKRKSVISGFNNFIYQILFLLFIFTIFIIYYIYLIKNKQLLLKEELQKITANCEILDSLEYNDSLTSLYNRKYFNLLYKEKLEIAKKNEEFIALIMVDIDCFSEYNNLYGFNKGDDILITLANILIDISDKNDFVFRFNGEAFVVLLTDTNEEKSVAFTNNILQILRDKKIEHKGSKIDNFLTVSIGMSYSKIDNTTTEYKLISDADKMLFTAKENGRNRAEITKGK